MAINYLQFIFGLSVTGGCKHAAAFLMWLQSKSNEPSVTDRKCYWKKPSLSRVASNRVATLRDFGKPESVTNPHTKVLVEVFLRNLDSICTTFPKLDMHLIALKFLVCLSAYRKWLIINSVLEILMNIFSGLRYLCYKFTIRIYTFSSRKGH